MRFLSAINEFYGSFFWESHKFFEINPIIVLHLPFNLKLKS